MPDIQIQQIVDKSDFVGYAIEDFWGYVDKTTDPNEAVGICYDLYKAASDGTRDYTDSIKCYSIRTLGEYSGTPGKRVISEFDWNRGLRELMC